MFGWIKPVGSFQRFGDQYIVDHQQFNFTIWLSYINRQGWSLFALGQHNGEVMWRWLKSKKQALASSENVQKPIIIVSGLPRSGTSMMMNMLQAGGITLVTDELRERDEDNPQGYFEFERVKQLRKGDLSWVSQAQGKAVKVISELLKYLPGTFDYKVIFMRRTMTEILASQKKMLEHNDKVTNSVSDAELAALFEKHLSIVVSWLDQQPNIDVLYINYNQMLAEPREPIKQINQFLGTRLNSQEMVKVINSDLYRQRLT